MGVAWRGRIKGQVWEEKSCRNTGCAKQRERETRWPWSQGQRLQKHVNVGVEGHMEQEGWQIARGRKAMLPLSPSPFHTLFSSRQWIYIWPSTPWSLFAQEATPPSWLTRPLRNHGDKMPWRAGSIPFATKMSFYYSVFWSIGLNSTVQEVPKRTMNETHQSYREPNRREIITEFGSTCLGKNRTHLMLFNTRKPFQPFIGIKWCFYLWICQLNWVKSSFSCNSRAPVLVSNGTGQGNITVCNVLSHFQFK